MRDLVRQVLEWQQLEDRILERRDERGSRVRLETTSTPEHGRHQTSESGIDALRRIMNSSSPSSVAWSIAGASYSASIRFQIVLARCAASRAPSSVHCSNELLSATSDR